MYVNIPYMDPMGFAGRKVEKKAKKKRNPRKVLKLHGVWFDDFDSQLARVGGRHLANGP